MQVVLQVGTLFIPCRVTKSTYKAKGNCMSDLGNCSPTYSRWMQQSSSRSDAASTQGRGRQIAQYESPVYFAHRSNESTIHRVLVCSQIKDKPLDLKLAHPKKIYC